MIKTILVDDEVASLRSLQLEIEHYCPEIQILKTFTQPRQALDQFSILCPDLVFLDIDMPDLNGFELLLQLVEIPFEVIFVTAYDQYAIKAFEFNAVDYLLKPVLKSKLTSAVQKVVERKNQVFTKQDLDALINNLQVQTEPEINRIALPTGEGFEFVPVDDIVQLRADSNYTWVFRNNGSKYLISKTLKEMSAMIRFKQFFRCHKSYLVNLNHVSKYVRGQGGYLVLNGEHIPVSRSAKDDLMRILNA